MFETVAFLLYGNSHCTKDAYLKEAKAFDNSVMERSLDGKLCLVTGANQGLGLATSIALAKAGAKLYMVCRNPERGEAAVAEVITASGNKDVSLRVCDLSSLQSIADLAAPMRDEAVYCLVNNAGVMLHAREASADVYDANTATNTLGTYALTALLAPCLEKCEGSRVITVSSGGMYTQPLEVADIENKKMGKSYDGTVAYAKDKRRQVAMMERFAKLLAPKGVGCYTMHPGWSTTEGVKKSIPGFYNFYKDKFRTVDQGIDTIVWLALQDQDKLKAGALYLDRAPRTTHLCMASTHYTEKDVDALFAKLKAMASKVIPEKELEL